MSAFSRKQFQQLRMAAGLSGEELAQRAGLSYSLVQKIERGNVRPSIRSLTRFAIAMGCKPSQLLDDSMAEDDDIPTELGAAGDAWVKRTLASAPKHMTEDQVRVVSAALFARTTSGGAA